VLTWITRRTCDQLEQISQVYLFVKFAINIAKCVLRTANIACLAVE